VLNIPTGSQLDPRYIAKRDLKAFPKVLSVREGVVKRADLENAYGRIQADLADVGRISGALIISPMDHLCSPDCAGLDSGGDPKYKDAAHLRPSYVRRSADFMDVTVK
jgi:hypothetical protein